MTRWGFVLDGMSGIQRNQLKGLGVSLLALLTAWLIGLSFEVPSIAFTISYPIKASIRMPALQPSSCSRESSVLSIVRIVRSWVKCRELCCPRHSQDHSAVGEAHCWSMVLIECLTGEKLVKDDHQQKDCISLGWCLWVIGLDFGSDTTNAPCFPQTAVHDS